MREYLLTSSIDQIKKGEEFPHGPLPRHVTIQQWFTLEAQAPFRNALTNLATTLTPFEVTGGKEALYGHENDVPVRVLRNIGKVAHLHAKTAELIERFDGELKNPQWSGEHYSPHVTYVDGQALEEDETVTLRTLELISREEASELRRVELVLPFTKHLR